MSGAKLQFHFPVESQLQGNEIVKNVHENLILGFAFLFIYMCSYSRPIVTKWDFFMIIFIPLQVSPSFFSDFGTLFKIHVK